MFNLESSIAEWREQMLAVGIQAPVPLEEIECHLREGIERQKNAGADERTAFEHAARQTGPPQLLTNEFHKIETSFMKIVFKYIAVFLVGIAAQLPGSLQLRDQLVMADPWLVLWLLGLFLQMWSLELLRRIIQPKFTGRKLKKVEWSVANAGWKTGTGVAVLLVGGALITPAIIQSVRDGLVTFDALCRLVLGVSLLIVGTLLICFPYHRRTA